MAPLEILCWFSFLWTVGMALLFTIRLFFAAEPGWFGAFAFPLTCFIALLLSSFVNAGLQALQGG